jgi:hypothetical protein
LVWVVLFIDVVAVDDVVLFVDVPLVEELVPPVLVVTSVAVLLVVG